MGLSKLDHWAHQIQVCEIQFSTPQSHLRRHIQLAPKVCNYGSSTPISFAYLIGFDYLSMPLPDGNHQSLTHGAKLGATLNMLIYPFRFKDIIHTWISLHSLIMIKQRCYCKQAVLSEQKIAIIDITMGKLYIMLSGYALCRKCSVELLKHTHKMFPIIFILRFV